MTSQSADITLLNLKAEIQAKFGYLPSDEQMKNLEFILNGKGHGRNDAAAGTGKTSTIMMCGLAVRGKSACYLAFSKEMEKEFKPRIDKFGLDMDCRTTYALGMSAVSSMLYRSKLKVVVNDDKYYELVDPLAQALYETEHVLDTYEMSYGDFKHGIKKLIDFARSGLREAKTLDLCEMIEYYSLDVIHPLMDKITVIVDAVFKQGIETALTTGVIDFLDMIWLPNVVKGMWVKQYDFLFIDECQDLSRAQLMLVMKAITKNGRILFTGDRDQSIMGFAGANPDSFDEIKRIAKTTELSLYVSRRCPKSHIALAQTVVPKIKAAPDAIDGSLFYISDRDVVKHVKEGDMIICRKTAPIVKKCIELIRARVPARIRGRDIGKALTSIIKEVGRRKKFTFADFIKHLDDYTERKLELLEKSTKPDLFESKKEEFLDKIEAIKAIYEWSDEDCNDLKSFIVSIEGTEDKYTKKTTGGLFSDDRNAVTLSTIHKAKGLEANNVTILDYDHIQIYYRGQKHWQRFQENCCQYVALTRSKVNLYIAS